MPAPAGQTLPTGRAEASEMPAGSATQEPGAGDNRLSFNPNDPEFEIGKEWEDGTQYRLTILATQSSPGELTVDKIESGEPASGEEGEGDMKGMMDEGETGAMGMAKDKYPNPAVAKLVEGEKS